MVHGPSTVGYGRASVRRHRDAATGLAWRDSGFDTEQAPDEGRGTKGAKTAVREDRGRYESLRGGRRSER
jgi:hypothetical protein